MSAVLVQVLPFFALIALGFGAGRIGFFGPEATRALTRFVFYFALPAMLFRFSATLPMAELWDPTFVLAYLTATGAIYLAVAGIALLRGTGAPVAAMEAQCAVIGNVGFLGIPMLVLLLGEAAIGPIMTVLAVDLVVFGALIVIVITGARDGRLSPRVLGTVGRGLLANPMIVAIGVGLAWSAMALPLPEPAAAFVTILGGAATPGALFAIGCSLAQLPLEKPALAGYLSTLKLVVHPAGVAAAALWFGVEPYAAGVMIAAAALPVAGNVYILAAHYGVAPARVSASILVSTTLAVLTIPAVIALSP